MRRNYTDAYYYRDSRRANQYVVGFAASVSGYSVGTIIGWAAPADKIMQKDGLRKYQLLITVAIAYLGAAVCQIYLAFRIQKLRRNIHILLASLPMIVAWAGMALCSNFYLYVAARFFLGFTGSLLVYVVPNFIIEIVEVELRASCVLLFPVMLCVGILVEFGLGLEQSKMVLCMPNVAPPSLLFLLMIYLKDTPCGYLFRNNQEGARKSLIFYRGKTYDVTAHLNDFQQYVTTSKGETKLGDINSTAGRKGLRILFICHTFQQLSGINLILHFNTDIFELGSSALYSPLSTVVFGCCFLISSIAGVILVQRERKILWEVSSFLMAAALCLMATYFYILNSDEVLARKITYFMLLAMCIFGFGFLVGVGLLPFLLISQILPPNSHLCVGCFVISYNCILACCNIVITDILRGHVPEGYIYMIYMVVNIFGLLYGSVWLPKKHIDSNEQTQND